ncbi:MAG: phosphatase PAP2 family protein [Actinomycetes bacterium]
MATAAARGRSAPGRSPRSRWRAIPLELAFVFVGVLIYFGVRGMMMTNVEVALENAQRLVTFERWLGVYVEPDLQTVVEGSEKLMTAMNWVYIWGHWPVIAVTLVWLFVRHPLGYRRYRNTMLLSGGIGLVAFTFFPVAPPRLADLGLVDTVSEYSTSYRLLQPPAFVNQYAAMPSLHVGWDLLMGLAIFTYARWRLVRVVGLLLPVLMVSSVVLTANHYLVDGVAGVALVLGSLLVVDRLQRRPRPALITLPGQRADGADADDAPARDHAPGQWSDR